MTKVRRDVVVTPDLLSSGMALISQVLELFKTRRPSNTPNESVTEHAVLRHAILIKISRLKAAEKVQTTEMGLSKIRAQIESLLSLLTDNITPDE